MNRKIWEFRCSKINYNVNKFSLRFRFRLRHLRHLSNIYSHVDELLDALWLWLDYFVWVCSMRYILAVLHLYKSAIVRRSIIIQTIRVMITMSRQLIRMRFRLLIVTMKRHAVIRKLWQQTSKMNVRKSALHTLETVHIFVMWLLMKALIWFNMSPTYINVKKDTFCNRLIAKINHSSGIPGMKKLLAKSVNRKLTNNSTVNAVQSVSLSLIKFGTSP